MGRGTRWLWKVASGVGPTWPLKRLQTEEKPSVPPRSGSCSLRRASLSHPCQDVSSPLAVKLTFLSRANRPEGPSQQGSWRADRCLRGGGTYGRCQALLWLRGHCVQAPWANSLPGSQRPLSISELCVKDSILISRDLDQARQAPKHSPEPTVKEGKQNKKPVTIYIQNKRRGAPLQAAAGKGVNMVSEQLRCCACPRKLML